MRWKQSRFTTSKHGPAVDKEQFHILIMDRNPHVRDFLVREFGRLGFTAHTAKNEREVAEVMGSVHPVHLVVLDPEAGRMKRNPFFAKLQRDHPALPVVVHMFSSTDPEHTVYSQAAAVVEKDGSIEKFVQTVMHVLENRYTAEDRRKEKAATPSGS